MNIKRKASALLLGFCFGFLLACPSKTTIATLAQAFIAATASAAEAQGIITPEWRGWVDSSIACGNVIVAELNSTDDVYTRYSKSVTSCGQLVQANIPRVAANQYNFALAEVAVLGELLKDLNPGPPPAVSFSANAKAQKLPKLGAHDQAKLDSAKAKLVQVSANWTVRKRGPLNAAPNY